MQRCAPAPSGIDWLMYCIFGRRVQPVADDPAEVGRLLLLRQVSGIRDDLQACRGQGCQQRVPQREVEVRVAVSPDDQCWLADLPKPRP
jgi:hypothetical protein